MCVVSAVMDHGRQQWPGLQDPTFWPIQPNGPPPPPVRIFHIGGEPERKLPTKAEIEAFLALYKAAQEYDAATGQPHCEDPEKIKLLAAIEKLSERLAALEGKLDAQASEKAEADAAFAASVKS